MRRRLRERRREREARLLDLGALVYELHRQGKRAPELLQEKAAELALVDEEVRELEAAIDGDGDGTAAAVEAEVEEPGDEVHEGEDEGPGATEDDGYDAAETHEADALDVEPEGDGEDDGDPEEHRE
jgi:hypothetical protein